MKLEELTIAKMMINRLCEKYPTMFNNGELKCFGYGYNNYKIAPTQMKEEIRYIRRLLLEVSSEL